MGRTVLDVSRVLQVIAGEDPSDPRQARGTPAIECLDAVDRAPEDLGGARIGVVMEGLGDRVGVRPEVADAVGEAIESLRALGAYVTDVSIPEHLLGETITLASSMEGMAALIAGGGNGYHWHGEYWPELATALEEGLAASAGELSAQVKLILLFGTHVQRAHLGAYYAKAQNIRSVLREGYDRALVDVDVDVMPTTPGTPHRYEPDLSISENGQARMGRARQHVGDRHDGPPGTDDPGRRGRRAPGGPDADRTQVRRRPAPPACAHVRARGRLAAAAPRRSAVTPS